MKEQKDPERSRLGRVFDAVRGVAREEAEEIKKDVVRDALHLKDEFLKYGKNRLVCGGALALKAGMFGMIGGPVVAKGAAAGGFVAGFFGGPALARRIERLFETKAAANENQSAAQSAEAEKESAPGAPPSPPPPT